MPHLPGLDGLRGLAVIGVLLFHGGFTWAKGGFLGVSTFFVLSGFLITNLLIREWDGSGNIRLSRFWMRRFRRLLPAAILTLLAVALIWWRLGTPEQLANLRWDLLASLGYAANWRFYFAGTTYADLFSAPSPLQHFWSLAIEEQYYLLFPLAVIALLKYAGRKILTIAICASTALSIGLVLWLGGDIDRIYYGTDTRAAELLIGSLLALWWSARNSSCNPFSPPNGAGSVLADIAGMVAVAGMFWSWWAVSDTSRLLSLGGLPAYAILTAIIIHATVRPGLVAYLLSQQVLRWVGRISYGLYLYHWPVFLILDEKRLGLTAVPLFAVQLTITTVTAIASYRWLEVPIRRYQVLQTDRAALGASLVGSLVVAMLAVVVTLDPPQSNIPYANIRLEDFQSVVNEDLNRKPADLAHGMTAETHVRKVLILGDSGMADASPALRTAFESAGDTQVIERAWPGLGLSSPFPKLKWRENFKNMINWHQPELVIIMLGGWDVGYVQDQGIEAYTKLVDEAANILTARGAKLLWLSMLPGGTTTKSSINRAYEQLSIRFPAIVEYLDIEASQRARGNSSSVVAIEGAEDWPRSYIDSDGSLVLLRKPDYWHLCPEGAERLALAVNRRAAALNWATEAVPGWQDGDWRNEPSYDDPRGGCVVD